MGDSNDQQRSVNGQMCSVLSRGSLEDGRWYLFRRRLIAYPGLNIAVGGYTDNVGSDQMNQGLSEHRAASVRDYLVQQGVPTNSITANGFGNTMPVASNDNSAGRQENRRVELVVSGESIGAEVNVTTGTLR